MTVHRDSIKISSDISLLVSHDFAMKNSQRTLRGSLKFPSSMNAFRKSNCLAPSV